MTLAEMVVKAMEAGLTGQRLPDFGYLSREAVETVNAVYDAARNRGAGERIRATRVK